MKKLTYTFLRCGILGWCLEIIFTALQSFRRREKTGMGNTSVFMFVIYGMAVFLKPVCALVKNMPVWLRGLVYTVCIFSAEYTAGMLLSRKERCPWNYAHSRYHINGLIRLDYAPLWFFAGLLFERMLTDKPKAKPKKERRPQTPRRACY